MLFYLLGLYLHPAKTMRTLAKSRAVVFGAWFLFVVAHFGWTWLELPFDVATQQDWPAYYSGLAYVPRVMADCCLTLLCFMAALGESVVHCALAYMGSFFVGTYLVHLYIFPDLPMVLEELALTGKACLMILLIV